MLAHGRSGIWGFGKGRRIRNSERKKKKKSIPISEREKMKKAGFLGVAAEGEADEEQRKEEA